MDYTNIIDRLARQLDTKAASTFFVNGAPGTGKTYLQRKLADELPTRLPRLKVLGPYKVGPTDSVGAKILSDLVDLRYLTDLPGANVVNDLNSTWRWLKDNLQAPLRQAFVVLIDLDGIAWDDYDTLRIWFSSMRYLEHLWDSGPARLAVLITSFWDHPGLDVYYADQLKLSFPYTISQNYMVWEEVPLSSSLELLGNTHLDDPIQAVYGKLLHEIAGGNPMVMLDILQQVEPGAPSVSAVLAAAHKAAQAGSAAQTLLKTWKKLSPDSIKAIKELLLLRQVPVKSLPPHLERLRVAGILNESMILNQRYVTLRSWYVELLLRLHADELGIGDQAGNHLDLTELMPPITILHKDAYLLVHEIENLLRNFLVTHLAAERSAGESLLSGRGYKDVTIYKNGETKKYAQDAQERAEQWRARSQEHGLPVHLNPEIAYLSLSDLGGIVKDLGELMDSASWRHVAGAVERVVYIRDAVMHNQIIEIADLQKIYDLQIEIFTALSETSTLFSKLN